MTTVAKYKQIIMKITSFIIVACFVVLEVDTFLTDGQLGRAMKYIETYNELEIMSINCLIFLPKPFDRVLKMVHDIV